MSQDFPIVIVKNLPYNATSSSIFDLFGKYGNINQLRIADSTDKSSMGTCFVVFNNVTSATQASSELNGVNFGGRYIVTSIYQVDKSKLIEEDYIVRKAQLDELKVQYGIK